MIVEVDDQALQLRLARAQRAEDAAGAGDQAVRSSGCVAEERFVTWAL